jgi:hypothetical protein
MNKISVLIQHFHGCPNGPEMITNVKKAIIQFGDKIDYQEILIDDEESAVINKFRGSPTLLINGNDFENMPEPLKPALSCRLYKNGVPNVEDIKNRISVLLGSI